MKNYTATIAGMSVQQFISCLYYRTQQPGISESRLWICSSLIHDLMQQVIPLYDISQQYNIPIELKELT